ncbi:MAG: diaminopimelate epimerase [Proteobacteria bacterium]|nr:diaminopimelate epimerase [Pseudomonadota bacterium]
MRIDFTKMHGLGNDFVVVDARLQDPALDGAAYRAIGDRRRGVGYDQFLTILPPVNGGAALMKIHNPDGSEAQACGNGTRCVAALLMNEANRNDVVIETIAGSLACRRSDDGRISVDMGPAQLDWRRIPLARAVDTLHVHLEGAPASDACCVNIGNPHAVFIVEDAEAIPLAEIGPVLEHNPIFPKRANIEFITIKSPTEIRMRVWERAAGITQACGSGACAALVAAVRRGLVERQADVILDGGTLTIEWTEAGRVLMTGPTATSFSGSINLCTLQG